MPILYNLKTGNVENITDEQVDNAIRSNNYAFRQGATVPIVFPDGGTGTIDASEANAAINSGFSFRTKAFDKQNTQAKIAEINREAYDSPFTAAALGGLSTATFGLSDVALRGIGGEDIAETARKIKEQSPIATSLGEIGGILSPVGAGGLIAKAGQTVGKAIVPSTSTIVSKIAQAGLGSATEGSLLGIQQLVSEAALNDPKLNAEHAISTVGVSTLLGGGFGAAGKTLGTGFNALKEVLKDPAERVTNLGVNLYTKAIGLLRGVDKEATDELLKAAANKEARNKLFSALDKPEEINKETVNLVSKLKETGEELNKKVGDLRKADRLMNEPIPLDKKKITLVKEVERAPKKSDFISEGAIQEGKAVDYELKQVTEKLTSEQVKILNLFKSTLKQAEKSKAYYSSEATNLLKQIRTDLKRDLSKAETLADQHAAVENARVLVDGITYAGPAPSKIQARMTKELSQNLRRKLADHLKDESVYGDFGRRYNEINQLWSPFLNAEKKFNKLFTSEVQEGIKRVNDINESKVINYFINPDSIKKQHLTDALNNFENTALNLSSKIKDADQLEILNNTINKINDVKALRSTAVLLNKLESSTGKSLAGAALGGVTAGIPGAIFGSAISNPKATLRILNKLENTGLEGQSRLVDSILKFNKSKPIETIKQRTPQIGIKELNNILDPELPSTDNPLDLGVKLEKVLGTQGYLDDVLQKNNPFLDSSAPESYVNIHNTIMDASRFVNSKIPKNTVGLFSQNKIVMSQGQKQKLENYIDAAFRPTKIYEELERGHINPETVETIKNVYPAIYSEVQKQVLNTITENKKDMPIKKQNELGKLFGIPANNVMQSIGYLQNLFAIPEQQPQPTGNLKTGAISKFSKTESDKLA